MFFDDDICYCGSECEHIECFRHNSHIRKPKNKEDKVIYTMGLLKNTEYCPLEKGKEE